MLQLKNNRLIRTIQRESVDATPVWIMRQAGRYLPEYRAVREKAGSFMKLCKTPELACEISLQPLQRFDLDACIIFSDILTIPDAMGLGLEIVEDKGPVFARPLRRADQINQLEVPDADRLSYVYEAIRLVQQELAGKVPLIGFSGSPWTLACYMVQGESAPGFPLARQMLNEDPFLLHNLLDIMANSVSAHLNAQIRAGVQVVMIFDTWGGMLDTHGYEEFSLYYIKQAIAGLLRNYNNDKIPVILFTRGGHRRLQKMADSGCDVVGVDWEITLKDARTEIGTKVALQGNMDPGHLCASPEVIRSEVQRVLDSYGNGPGHIFNLGHGITPEVPPEHVRILVDAVHELSKKYHV